MLVVKDLVYQEIPELPKFTFNYEFKSGKTYMIRGESYSGKSILLQCIGAFLFPMSGSVTYNDKELIGIPASKLPLTLTFQQENLFPKLDPYMNIAAGISTSIEMTEEIRTFIQYTINHLGIDTESLLRKREQKIAVARAAARAKYLDKKLILLDEPFLDMRRSEMNKCKELLNEFSDIILINTHSSHSPNNSEDIHIEEIVK
tara:strand:- start:507 stop:1115 length:609 start_codon:yes stop_codon:yes gene_type:complete